MLTSRGWWFLIAVLTLVALGLFDERWTLAILGLSLLSWFLAEWLLFALRVRLVVPALQSQRSVWDDRGPVNNLWAGRTFQISVRLGSSHSLGLPYVRIRDFLPFGVALTQGTTECSGGLGRKESLTLKYHVRCDRAGLVRFEGLQIELADLQGFFYRAAFAPGVLALRVLPPLADARGHRPSVKRHNLLPSPGLHRHLRPGSGSDLLDLRDYLPGDPPKTIAWKVSARRDRLITKEFESEVPLRCTLFIDASQSVRIGPPGQNALARLVDISAALAQATAASRDLVGLCLFDDARTTTMIRPARGKRHLIKLLNLLADAAALAPASGEARVATLLPLGYALAEELYPDLLREDVNHVPAWLPWTWNIPAEPREGRSFFKRGLGPLLAGVGLAPLAGAAWLVYYFSDFVAAILWPVPDTVLAALGIAFLGCTAFFYYTLLRFGFRSLFLVLSRRRRQLARWRKQVAAILAERYGLGAGGIGLLLEDDECCALYLQRFLADHQVPYPVPLYDRAGRYLFSSPGKVSVLAKALLHAVGRGRDNELFVLLVDLLELAEDLEPLRRAVKITLARHHQVVLVCPWPPGVPPPGKDAQRSVQASAMGDLQQALEQTTTERLQRAFQSVRQAFARLGVTVVCAEGGDPVRLILDRLERLRSVGMGRPR